jgi:hypothetical protein
MSVARAHLIFNVTVGLAFFLAARPRRTGIVEEVWIDEQRSVDIYGLDYPKVTEALKQCIRDPLLINRLYTSNRAPATSTSTPWRSIGESSPFALKLPKSRSIGGIIGPY